MQANAYLRPDEDTKKLAFNQEKLLSKYCICDGYSFCYLLFEIYIFILAQ